MSFSQRTALSIRSLLNIMVAGLLICAPSFAFQSPLSDESIREAYFLGQRNDQTMYAFFTQYLRAFDRPQGGPFVSEVEVYTPFVQLVELSRVRNFGYSAQQATQDYRRGEDTLFVRVRIEFTPTYGTPQYLANLYQNSDRPVVAARRADFGQDFRFAVVQGERRIEPLAVDCYLTNTAGGGHFPFDPDGFAAWMHGGNYGGSGYGSRGSSVTGWMVWLQFDANDLASSDDAQIDILGPDNLHLAAKYDFGRLR